MASEVDIANRALSMLGENRIINLSDNNKPARAMNARYELLRDALLNDYPWRFSVKRVQLAASISVPDWGFSTIYPLPSDDIKTIKVGGSVINSEAIGVMYEATGYAAEEAPYEIIEGEIHTNLSAPLDYEYIARITDAGKFNPLFVEALASWLAADAAEELTQSDRKQARAEKKFREIIRTAKRNNALMRPPRRLAANRWTRSRVVG